MSLPEYNPTGEERVAQLRQRFAHIKPLKESHGVKDFVPLYQNIVSRHNRGRCQIVDVVGEPMSGKTAFCGLLCKTLESDIGTETAGDYPTDMLKHFSYDHMIKIVGSLNVYRNEREDHPDTARYYRTINALFEAAVAAQVREKRILIVEQPGFIRRGDPVLEDMAGNEKEFDHMDYDLTVILLAPDSRLMERNQAIRAQFDRIPRAHALRIANIEVEGEVEDVDGGNFDATQIFRWSFIEYLYQQHQRIKDLEERTGAPYDEFDRGINDMEMFASTSIRSAFLGRKIAPRMARWLQVPPSRFFAGKSMRLQQPVHLQATLNRYRAIPLPGSL